MFDDAGTSAGDKTLEDKFFEYEVRQEISLLQVDILALS